MNGNVDQVKKAEQIKERINAEFDRLARALESSAAKQTGQDRKEAARLLDISLSSLYRKIEELEIA